MVSVDLMRASAAADTLTILFPFDVLTESVYYYFGLLTSLGLHIIPLAPPALTIEDHVNPRHGGPSNFINLDDDDDDDSITSSSQFLSSLTLYTPRRLRYTARSPASLYTPTFFVNPPSHYRRRVNPRGIYLGTWRRSGLPVDRNNTVYGSRDRRHRINRRINKEIEGGIVVQGGNYDRLRTACSHPDIKCVTRYRGLSKE